MLALGVFAALAVEATWPFAIRPATTLTAPIGYDVSGSVAKFAAIVREGTTPFSSGTLHSIAAPGGVPLTPGLDAASVLSSAPLWLGSATIGAIPTHGLFTLLGLILTATAAFLFVRWLTGSVGAGLVAGIAAGFFAHIRLIAVAAQTYTHLWAYILVLWAFTALIRRPDRRRALLAGLSVLPAVFWTPYFTLHVLVEALACGLVALAVLAHTRGWGVALGRVALTAVPVVAGLVAYVGIGVANGFADVPTRESSDLYTQSAHPLMYLLPGHSAWAWGEGPYEALVDAVPRAVGTNSYLGLSVLALAGVACAWLARGAVRSARRPRPARRPPSRAAAAGLLAAATAAAALVWSLPPTIGLAGVDVPMPSMITTEAAPALRAGQRFVMLAMVALAVLAGVGAARLLRRIPPRAVPAVAAAIAAVVAVDVAAVPVEGTTRVAPSPALTALAGAPDGLAIHYQGLTYGGLAVGRVARPCVLQIQHGHPLVNGCNFSDDPALIGRLLGLDDVGSCETLRSLQGMGVRYVILDAGLQPARCRPGPRLAPLARDEDFAVARLAAAGASPDGGSPAGGI